MDEDILESALLELWNRGHDEALRTGRNPSTESWSAQLAVYADALQSRGDPRGELIALDLLPARSNPDSQHKKLISTWLGDGLGGDSRIKVAHGLLTLSISADDSDVLERVLAGPGKRYIESVSLHGSDRELETLLTTLGEHRYEWLHSLSLESTEPTHAPKRSGLQHLLASSADTFPFLRVLRVCGAGMVSVLPHTSLRKLVCEGYDTLLSLTKEAIFQSVVEVDLAFQGSRYIETPLEEQTVRLLEPQRFQSLRRLDLSRNDPGYSANYNLGGTYSAFVFLNSVKIKSQLTHVRLPSIRSATDANSLTRALSAMPELIWLSVSGNYFSDSTYRHPNARLRIPEAFPWPHPDAIPERATLELEVSNHPGVLSLDLCHIVTRLERSFADLEPAVRDTWSQFWRLVRSLLENPAVLEISLPTSTLRRVLDSCANLSIVANNVSVATWSDSEAFLLAPATMRLALISK